MMLIISLTTVSCDKESPDEIIIGKINGGIRYHDVVPDTIITSWETVSDFQIDVDDDNAGDYNISVLNQYMFGGMSLWNSELRIETLNAHSFVLTEEGYPKSLSYADILHIDDKWENDNLLLLHSWEECCPPTGISFHEGYWRDENENYIGIKYKNRLGWIKIGVDGYTSVKIFEYAVVE